MARWPCQYCAHRAGSYPALVTHNENCLGRKARMNALGTDLAAKVAAGDMKLDDALAEQATCSKLVLD